MSSKTKMINMKMEVPPIREVASPPCKLKRTIAVTFSAKSTGINKAINLF
jgi:hypothetical protein